METQRWVRAAFLIGSLFTILLIVYWDDVAPFNLYSPHRDPPSPGPPPPQLDAFFWGAAAGMRGLFSSLLHTRDQTEDGPAPRAEEEGRQEERRKQIRDVCSSSAEFPGRNRSFDQIPNKELDHLIVDDRHKVIYCFVPKIACTNWKRIMLVLQGPLAAGGLPYRDPGDVPVNQVHNQELHLTLNRLARPLMSVKLQNYTKFLFVRDPFVRLISAYRDKFEHINQNFYERYGSEMLRRYGNGDKVVNGAAQKVPNSAAEAYAAGIRPSFLTFVRYLLDPQTERKMEFDEHWRQVHRLCHPCQVHYDFVGRLEDLEQDSDQMLRILGLDGLIQFPPSINRNRTAASRERDWFRGVPLDMRRKLYELYEPDFKLFGYPKPEDLLHI